MGDNFHTLTSAFISHRALRLERAALTLIEQVIAAPALVVTVTLCALALAAVLVRCLRAQASLRESEERFRLLVQDAQDFAIFMLDPAGHIVTWNAGAQRIKGYASAEIIGRHFSCFYTQEEQQSGKAARKLETATREGRYEEEGWRVRKDGSHFWANVVINALRDANGQLRGFSKMTRDISARKHMQDELLRQRDTYELLLQGLSDLGEGVIIFEGERLVFVNDAASRIIGHTKEELMALGSLTSFVIPDTTGDRADRVQKLRAGLDYGRYESRVRHKDGHIISLEASTKILRQSNPPQFISVTRDITARKRAEQELVRSTALVQLLQVVAVASNEALSLEDALASAMREICAYTGWPLGHVYMTNAAGELASTSLWQGMEADSYAAFRAATEAMHFVRGVGMPGRVLASAQPLWIADIARDANFPRAAVAAACGIVSAFAFPILLKSEVVGMLEFFTSVRAEPDAALLELVVQIGHQIGRVVERRRNEQALAESERRFRTLAMFAPVGIFEADPSGLTVFVNDAWGSITGMPNAEALGNGWARLIHPDDRAQVFAAWQATVGGEQGTAEARFLRDDGRVVWFNVSITPLRDAEGASVGYLGAVLDISERKRMEEELREQRDQYSVLLQALSDLGEGVGIGEGERIVFANDALCQIVGYTSDELRAMPSLLALSIPDSRDTLAERLRRVNAGTEAGRYVNLLRHKAGHTVPLEISSKIVQYNGRSQRISVMRDISERKRMEEEIRQQRDRYSTLLDGLSDMGEGVLIAEGQRLVYANDAFCKLSGYSYEELLALPSSLALVVYEEKQLATNLIERVSSGSDVGRFEIRLRHKAGHIFPLELTSKLMEFDGKPQRLSVARDISARKHAEAELRAFATRLEQSNRELQDFAFVASHDLQEPLRKIQAFGDRLKHKYGPALEEQGSDYLDRMQRAAARMQALIGDLLAFSRITNRPEPFQPVNLDAITREVISDLEVHIAETSGRVGIDVLPTIDADPLQMRQLLQNLIANALKFRREGAPPVITISAHGGVANEHGAPAFQLLIADNGIGFDEKYLDRIFTPFQRLHGRERYEGTGMGLAICRRIAERHSGSITAKSTPGLGSTFIITLPNTQFKGGYLR